MIILVTGLDESGRDEIIEMVLQGCKNMLPHVTLIKASEFMPDIESERSITRLAAMRENALAKLEKTVVSSLKGGGNIVLTGGATKSTKHGYMPLITEDFIEKIKPDLIILMEVVPHRIESYMEHEHMDWQQQKMERYMASMFSLRTGALLRVIRVKSGKVKDAIKESADALRAAMT